VGSGLGGAVTDTPTGPVTSPPTPSPVRQGHPDRVFKLVSLVAALALLGFIAYVVVRARSSPQRSFPVSPPTSLAVGTAAPDFTLPALGGGPPVALSSWRGHPVIVNFFASWCSHCQAELAAVAGTARADAGRVAVVGVDANDTDKAALAQLAAAHADYPVGVDPKNAVTSAYLIQALPVTYFVGADGRVRGVAFGQQSRASLGRWVAHLTGGSPPR